MKKNVVLIGAGISGLSTLYFFLKKNAKQISKVEIFEKEKEIGGVLGYTQKNDFIFEHGAQGVLSTRTNFSSLVSELNLTKKLCIAESKKANRSFFVKNKIVQLSPKNIIEMFRVKLISIPIILRVLAEYFTQKQNKISNNETVEDFFSRHFGKKFTKNFLAPVMKGIWGGGMSRILVRFAFPNLYKMEQSSILKSIIKGKKSSQKSKKEMLSFVNGMTVVPHKLLEEIEKICEENKIELHLNLNSTFTAQEQKPNNLIIYSGQPWRDKNFLEMCRSYENKSGALKSAVDVLKNIPTHTLVVVGIGSSNKDIENRLDGFGALAVENNPEGVLGVIAVHSLNEHHVPDDSFLYRIMMGGENLPKEINLITSSDAEIIHLAKTYLQKYKLLNTTKTYTLEIVSRHINYLPLPTEYQEKVLEAVNTLEEKMPGFFLTGNYILGPAVDNCIEQAHITAEKISNYISIN